MSHARFAWLKGQISRGRSAHVSFSFNAKIGTEKVKFMLDASGDSDYPYRPGLFAALLAVETALKTCIVTDKGHRSHTTGQSIIEFWMKQPTEPNCVDTILSHLKPSLNPNAAEFIPVASSGTAAVVDADVVTEGVAEIISKTTDEDIAIFSAFVLSLIHI